MAAWETEKFREAKEKAKPLILELINEYSLLSQRSIQVKLEEYGLWENVTWNALLNLENAGKIRTAKYPPRGNYPKWVYKANLRLQDVRDEITNQIIPIYRKFVDVSGKMASFCENIIEEALTKAGFITLSRNAGTKYFHGRTCHKKNDLDFIAYFDGVFYGIEVKNSISYPDSAHIFVGKKAVADYHDIQFLLVARTLGPLSYRIFKSGGLYLEFEKLIWSSKFSSFAKKVEEKFLYPIMCIKQVPDSLVSQLKGIPLLQEKYFREKGRI